MQLVQVSTSIAGHASQGGTRSWQAKQDSRAIGRDCDCKFPSLLYGEQDLLVCSSQCMTPQANGLDLS